MVQVAFKSIPVHTNGELPEVGAEAPDFQLAGQDLSDVSLKSFGEKKKILNIFPSMDTSVCSIAMRTFYEKCKSIPNLALINISLDLPFAAARFCKEHQLGGAVTLSAFRSKFPEDYGIRITDSPMKGLTARAVIVLDESNKVVYQELIPEITQEPNYNAALQSIQRL